MRSRSNLVPISRQSRSELLFYMRSRKVTVGVCGWCWRLVLAVGAGGCCDIPVLPPSVLPWCYVMRLDNEIVCECAHRRQTKMHCMVQIYYGADLRFFRFSFNQSCCTDTAGVGHKKYIRYFGHEITRFFTADRCVYDFTVYMVGLGRY